MLESCQNLTIMLSSCEWIDLCPTFPSTFINILELDRIRSVHLFMQVTSLSELRAEEVHDLVKSYPKVNFKEVSPDMSEEDAAKLQELQTLKRSPQKRILLLAAHDLFQQLDGNPYSIKTIAAFYRNPHVTNNDLKGIYQRLSDLEKHEEDLSISSRRTMADAARRRVETRRKGIEAVLDLLTERSSSSSDTQLGALSLFYFLGCFDQGLTDETLHALWPGHQLDENLYFLKRLGVLEIGAPRLTLNRLLQKYVANTKFQSCEWTLMSALCSHYLGGVLHDVYDTPTLARPDDIKMAMREQKTVLMKTGMKRTQGMLLSLYRHRKSAAS